jgi:hypothetical protein
VSLSDEAVAYVESHQARGGKQVSFSQALDEIINDHLGLAEKFRLQKSLAQLRAAATELHDLEISTDAILAWVKQAAGGK